MRPGSRTRGGGGRRGVVAAAVVVAALLLAGCSDAISAPGATNVEVDTPALRAMKVEAGIEDCRPGSGAGELPDLTLPCLGGGPDVALDSLDGPLIINLWFSGCGPCRDEMPALQSFYAAYGDQVGVLGIDVENYPEAAISFAGMVGATYPQLADPGGEIFDQPDLRVGQGFPQFIVIDADGRVVHQAAGGLDTEAEVVAMAEEHLGVTL